ncbi:hypothetical protein BU25DRAFT_343373 [Macroventuria anomochaeta]|uniref:Uncharacterized protein n=1 Tax=Macroventuria anomochaeta TaxID=301207 RepID=A0ACB6RX68_9PLEO|nr:uncharacterized protein BU25DRAFT_343373 [Macroventuria anomochaeta]KAF2626565.1 hypothetical protein BU25DRAFT_343373 [Macroventuria anomochaeta]
MATTTPFPPTDATSVGFVPLTVPFQNLTFYTKAEKTNELLYNLSSPATLSPNSATGIVAGGAAAASIVNLLWNSVASDLEWWTQKLEDPSPITISHQHVAISAVVSSTTVPSTNSATLSGATLASSITDASVSNALPSSTTNSKQTSTPQPTGNGISGGAVAGVAIGCLVAGVLIAGLIAWFCWGRRRASRLRHHETSAIALMPPEKGPMVHTRPLGGESPLDLSTGTGLPQPLEDQAISGEISKIGNLIKNHVQSYYHSKPVNPGLIDLDDIVALGRNLPISTGTLSTLLDNSATREVALRFCIAFAIITRLQSYGNPAESLLPPEFCAPMREISDAKYGSKAHTVKAARWRATTAELMHSTYVQDAFTSSDPRNAAIRSLTHVLENTLQPFADLRMNNEERKRNLEEILKRSAIFAFTLFSQPSSWDFDWKEEQGVKSGELCIFPALVQVTNEVGEPIRPPRSFSEAVVRRLEG